jgi:hypothetical protein
MTKLLTHRARISRSAAAAKVTGRLRRKFQCHNCDLQFVIYLRFAVCRHADFGMPVEERFSGCTEKRTNVDAGSIKLGEFYGASGAVFAADADGRVVWLLMRPVVDQRCGYCKHKFGKAESAYMGGALGPVADVVQKGKDIDHLM